MCVQVASLLQRCPGLRRLHIQTAMEDRDDSSFFPEDNTRECGLESLAIITQPQNYPREYGYLASWSPCAPTAVTALTRSFPASLPNLRILVLTMCTVGDGLMAALGTAAPKLESLAMFANAVTPGGLATFLQHDSPRNTLSRLVLPSTLWCAHVSGKRMFPGDDCYDSGDEGFLQPDYEDGRKQRSDLWRALAGCMRLEELSVVPSEGHNIPVHLLKIFSDIDESSLHAIDTPFPALKMLSIEGRASVMDLDTVADERLSAVVKRLHGYGQVELSEEETAMLQTAADLEEEAFQSAMWAARGSQVVSEAEATEATRQSPLIHAVSLMPNIDFLNLQCGDSVDCGFRRALMALCIKRAWQWMDGTNKTQFTVCTSTMPAKGVAGRALERLQQQKAGSAPAPSDASQDVGERENPRFRNWRNYALWAVKDVIEGSVFEPMPNTMNMQEASRYWEGVKVDDKEVIQVGAGGWIGQGFSDSTLVSVFGSAANDAKRQDDDDMDAC